MVIFVAAYFRNRRLPRAHLPAGAVSDLCQQQGCTHEFKKTVWPSYFNEKWEWFVAYEMFTPACYVKKEKKTH